MIIKLDMSSDTPIYQQLRNEIVMGIGSGKLASGEGLPTVRQLASDLGINPMTVQKSYSLLKDEGFIEIDRRHGARVREIPKVRDEDQERFDCELSALIGEALARGLDKWEFLELVAKIFDSLSEREGK